MTIVLRNIIILSFFFVFISTNLYAQGSCDINNYSSDPLDFADLPVHDLQNYPQGTSTWNGTDYITIGDIAVTGNAWIINNWCIPNMDSNAPGCGGENHYIASPIDMTIEPQVPVNRIAFDYGTQGNVFNFEVTLSDGTVVSLTDLNTDYSSATGFFGYCTGNSELTITSIYLSGFDGGIDNIRYGVTGGNDCTVENLGQKIVDLSLHQGTEKSLLAQLNAATNALNRGNPGTAIAIFGAMINHIEAQHGKKIPVEDADLLLECIEAIINELS